MGIVSLKFFNVFRDGLIFFLYIIAFCFKFNFTPKFFY